MNNPSHPGVILFSAIEDLVESGQVLEARDATDMLGLNPASLAMLMAGNLPISKELAERISMAFGSTPGMWLRLQQQFDLASGRA